jgi:hypothetical protein
MSIPDGCFDSLLHLKNIELRSAALTTIAESAFSPSLRSQLESLLVGNNPFACDCQLLFFRGWYLSEQTQFENNNNAPQYIQNPEGICTCIADTGKHISLADFKMVDQACLLTQETSSRIVFVISLMIISFTAFILVFTYRWHFRLLMYEAFRGKGEARRRYLEEGHFNYDLFVCYASEQLRWVEDHLMPQLEGHLGLRLCVSEQDFIPGRNIVDNIDDCVESSRKIMMVFSRDFVRSHWCQFELAYCLSHHGA